MIIGSLLLIFAAVVMLSFGLPAKSDPLLIGSIVATLFAVIVLIGSARRTAALRLAAGAEAPTGSAPRGGQGAATTRPGPARSGKAEGRPAQRVADRAPAGGAVIEGTLVEEPVTVRAAPAAPAGTAPDPDPEPAAAEPGGSKATTVTADRTTATADRTTATERTTVGLAAAGDGGRDATIPTQTRPTIDLNARPASSVDTADGDDYDEDGEFSDEDPPGEPPPQLVSAADAALVATMDATVLVVDGRPRYHRPGCAHLRGRPTQPLPVSEAVELGFTPCSRCEPDTALIAGARPS